MNRRPMMAGNLCVLCEREMRLAGEKHDAKVCEAMVRFEKLPLTIVLSDLRLANLRICVSAIACNFQGNAERSKEEWI